MVFGAEERIILPREYADIGAILRPDAVGDVEVRIDDLADLGGPSCQ